MPHTTNHVSVVTPIRICPPWLAPPLLTFELLLLFLEPNYLSYLLTKKKKNGGLKLHQTRAQINLRFIIGKNAV